jgi:uncharacterized membrane protein YfcA
LLYSAVEIFYLILIFFAGIVVAFINTISAAGSLVSLSVFMFTGLTPLEANATNRIPILFHNIFTVKGFESKGLKSDAYVWWLSLATIPGAIAGAFWAVKIPADIFDKILVGVMILFLVITIVNPLNGIKKGPERMDRNYKIAGVIIYAFIGFYGGFIQAGSGFFLVAPILLLHRFDIHKSNYYKAFITLIYTLSVLPVFLWKGNIHWTYAVVMSLGTSIGGWMTSRWSVTVDELWMKRIMVSVILSLTVYVWFFK